MVSNHRDVQGNSTGAVVMAYNDTDFHKVVFGWRDEIQHKERRQAAVVWILFTTIRIFVMWDYLRRGAPPALVAGSGKRWHRQ